MAVNDIYQVTLYGQLHGQVINNVLHYRTTATVAATTAIETAVLSGAFQAAFTGVWLAGHSAEYALAATITQKIWPAPTALPLTNTAWGGFGTVAGSSLPTSMSGILRKGTQFAGPKYRGRLFLAGVPAAWETDSALNASADAPYGAIAAAMLLVLNDGTGNIFEPVLYHRAAHTADKLVTVTIHHTLRNQRRRQLGRGA